MVTQRIEPLGAGLDADRDGDVVHLLRSQQRARVHLPGVEDLAAQRHHGLELAVPRLLGRATGRVALDQEQLGALRVLQRAVGQLPGQGRAGDDPLARDLLARPYPRLRVADRQLRDPLAGVRVLVEPQRELVLDDPGDEGRGLARGESFLGLAGELRVAHLGREHVAGVVPDVLGRELEPPRQQAPELAELADRLGEAEPEAVDVGSALQRRDQVDVALLDPARAVQPPHDGPVHALLLALDAAGERIVGQVLGRLHRLAQVLRQPAAVEPLVLLAGLLDGEPHREARAEHGLGPEHVL